MFECDVMDGGIVIYKSKQFCGSINKHKYVILKLLQCLKKIG